MRLAALSLALSACAAPPPPASPRVLGDVRHRGGVYDAVAAPDGSWIATAGDDGTLRVWDPESRAQLRSFQVVPPEEVESPTHAMRERPLLGVTTIGVDPRGRWLAAATAGGRIVLWDLPGWRMRAADGTHDDLVTHILPTDDGARFATVSDDETIAIHDAASGRLVKTLAGSHASTLAAESSPDGRWIVTVGETNWRSTARLWDAASGRQLWSIPSPWVGRIVIDVATSRVHLHSVYDPHDREIDLLSGAVIRPYPRAPAPRAERIAQRFATRDHPIGHEPMSRVDFGRDVKAIACSPDGRHAFASTGGEVSLWNLEDGTEVGRMYSWAARALLAPDDTSCLVASAAGLEVLRRSDDEIVVESVGLGLEGCYWRTSSSRQGRAALMEDWEGIWIVDGSPLGVRRVERLLGRPAALAWEPNGQRLLIACEGGAVVRVDASSGAVVDRFATDANDPESVAVGTDGRIAIATGEAIHIHASDGALLATIDDDAEVLAVSPDGQRLYCASDRHLEVRVRDFRSLDAAPDRIPCDGGPRVIEFAGHRVLVGCADGTIRIHDDRR